MNLLQHELIHLFITTLVAIFVLVRFGKKKSTTGQRPPIANYWLLITIVFLVGIFLDADHLFDYLLWSKGAFVLRDFLNPSLYVHLSGKVYIPLHGFEIGIILWIFSRWLEKKTKLIGLSLALTLSYFSHLLWDNFSFPHYPLAYSLIYRIITKFSVFSFDGH